MDIEKVFCIAAMAVAVLVALIFVADIAIGTKTIVLDVMFLIGAALVIWQGLSTYRELR